MKTDSRLSMALHALLHMSEAGVPVTSQQLAERMCADASVIRRTLAGLREAQFICSEKGHGGGWQLNCRLVEITLLDIYYAVGKPTRFAIGLRQTERKCLVETAINKALENAMTDAEDVFLSRLRAISIAELSAQFVTHYRRHKGNYPSKTIA